MASVERHTLAHFSRSKAEATLLKEFKSRAHFYLAAQLIPEDSKTGVVGRDAAVQFFTTKNIKTINIRRLTTSAICKLTPYQSRCMDR
jgi:hypothetical protein